LYKSLVADPGGWRRNYRALTKAEAEFSKRKNAKNNGLNKTLIDKLDDPERKNTSQAKETPKELVIDEIAF